MINVDSSILRTELVGRLVAGLAVHDDQLYESLENGTLQPLDTVFQCLTGRYPKSAGYLIENNTAEVLKFLGSYDESVSLIFKMTDENIVMQTMQSFSFDVWKGSSTNEADSTSSFKISFKLPFDGF